MMLKTVTFDDATHKIVPLEPTEVQIKAANSHHEGGFYLPVSLYKAMIAAAPEYKGIESSEKCSTPEKCRLQETHSYTTCAYYPPIYDRSGRNLNPDRNTTTGTLKCLTCGKEFKE